MLTVFSSERGHEAAQVCGMLQGAGFHAVMTGATGIGALGLISSMVQSTVQVPDDEFEDARRYLDAAEIVFDGASADGSTLEGQVCPVHEQPALAICGRCGTFLCQQCHALGDVPLCEACVARSDERPPSTLRAVSVAGVRLWLFFVILSSLVALGLGLASRLAR